MAEATPRIKVGIQTIVWEDQRSKGLINRREILEQAKAAGYDGIELFESPRDIDLKELLQQLNETELELTGFTGGAFSDRLELAIQWKKLENTRPIPYLYCDEKRNKHIDKALTAGLSVALHPHMFKPVQTLNEAEEMVATYKREFAAINRPCDIHLMLDSAHLYIAGDDALSALDKHFSEIKCIHLKDWTPEFGRSYQFYARGFVALGLGDVKLKEILKMLTTRGYPGWLVVEVDSPADPTEAANVSRKFLRDSGI